MGVARNILHDLYPYLLLGLRRLPDRRSVARLRSVLRSPAKKMFVAALSVWDTSASIATSIGRCLLWL